MAGYKVPQDVEADDKLLGPFSFRQFIYLIIVAMGIAIGWGLASLFVPLALIPLPVIIFFGALALPLKKDQPMEVYLAALLSFYLKPRKRLWEADGVQSLIEIVEPPSVEEQLTKDITQSEASRRLEYLASIADTRGWAVRGVDFPHPSDGSAPGAILGDPQAEDILDDNNDITRTFDSMIGRADAKRHQKALDLVNQASTVDEAPKIPDPYGTLSIPSGPAPEPYYTPVSELKLKFNPYPQAMRQSVIHPAAPEFPTIQAVAPPQPAPQPASQPLVSPDIINLANNTELSIETIEREASRIRKKEEQSSGQEVVVPLR